MFTHKMYRAAKDAIAVQDGCNGSGIAQVLVRAYQAWLESSMSTELANRSPAVILILDKLCDLGRLDHLANTDRYARCLAQCEEIIEMYERENPFGTLQFANDEVKAKFKEAAEYAEKVGKTKSFKTCRDSLQRYADQEDTEVRIGPDFVLHSFTFAVMKMVDGEPKVGLHGGMIYHGPEAGEALSVQLKPTDGWQLHT